VRDAADHGARIERVEERPRVPAERRRRRVEAAGERSAAAVAEARPGPHADRLPRTARADARCDVRTEIDVGRDRAHVGGGEGYKGRLRVDARVGMDDAGRDDATPRRAQVEARHVDAAVGRRRERGLPAHFRQRDAARRESQGRQLHRLPIGPDAPRAGGSNDVAASRRVRSPSRNATARPASRTRTPSRLQSSSRSTRLLSVGPSAGTSLGRLHEEDAPSVEDEGDRCERCRAEAARAYAGSIRGTWANVRPPMRMRTSS
jgi:hypothetical protein